jgi:hypothetical protein
LVIKVKFVAKTTSEQDPNLWLSLFPGRTPQIGDVHFSFDLNDRDYDWLVAYEGFPMLPGQKKSNRSEMLACARKNTIIITTEPSSIRVDGPHFLRQFGHVLSAKNHDLVKHPNQIHQTPPLRWYYGRPLGNNDRDYIDVDQLKATKPIQKTRDLSMICSNKRMSATLHARRYDFLMELKERLGEEIAVFGRGIRPIDDKSEGMDDYRYHIALENHIEPDHWTEKIADCFLAYCLPFYYGPPNISEYFPEDSYIRIDMFDTDGAIKIIRNSIANDEYSKRLPAIIEARRRVLANFNLMNIVASLVEANHDTTAITIGGYIHARHIFRRKHPILSLSDGLHRLRTQYRVN